MQEMLLQQSKVMMLKKCITIRPTSFDPAETSGGSAEIVKGDAGEPFSIQNLLKKKKLNLIDQS